MRAEHVAELTEPAVAFVPPGLTAKEALELAALDAAVFRSASKKTLERKINIVGKDGSVRPGVGRDVLRGLAKIQGLEHVVEEGVRPKEVVCRLCGKTVKATTTGPIQTTCRSADGGCSRQKLCAGFGDTEGKCERPIPKRAAFISANRQRGGQPWRCASCASKRRSADPEIANRLLKVKTDPAWRAKQRERALKQCEDPTWQQKQKASVGPATREYHATKRLRAIEAAEASK